MAEILAEYKTDAAKSKIVRCVHCQEMFGVSLSTFEIMVGNLVFNNINAHCLGCGAPFAWRISKAKKQSINKPTPEEQEQAEERVIQMNTLAPFCNFSMETPVTQEQLLVRQTYNQILAEQTIYENKYC